jgi:proteasome lid subunit RPN8/RPN11
MSGETEIDTVRRTFPVSSASGEPLRIALNGSAYAEIVAHAKATLDEEVCGVVVGEFCEDDQGIWVDGKAAIRGTSSKQGSTHVTYTQETWQKIYEVKDRDYPNMAIVGWYHTHPGFGVEFSDMDRFIQQNFFRGPAQFALVQDPLGGEEAICVNAAGGLRDVGRYWVDGRPRKCWTPPVEETAAAGGSVPRDFERRLTTMQDQIGQLVQIVHQDGERRQRFHSIVGILLGTALALWILFSVFKAISPPNAPEHVQWINAPVVLDGKTVQLGIELKKWQLPPEMDAYVREIVRQRLAQEKARLGIEEPEPEHEDSKSGHWITSLPVIVGFALIVLLLIFSVVRMIVQGVRKGARQRK